MELVLVNGVPDIEVELLARGCGFRITVRTGDFFFLEHPDSLLGPQSLLLNECPVLYWW